MRDVFILQPCLVPLGEIYRDDDIVVVDKPSGLLSVPGKPPNHEDSALGRLIKINPESRVVHRLDMATSGLMVFALNAESHRHLSRQFQDRQVEKRYIADVWGQVEAKQGAVDLPLRCDWSNRPKQMVDHELGKTSLTHYQVIESVYEGCDRVLLTPITGRSHQLRVHMAELGHPIIGCGFYAHEQARQRTYRLHLHAAELSFTHPLFGEWLSFRSDAPF